MSTNAIDVPLGWALPKRKKHLADLVKSDKGKYSFQLTFQGSQQTLPVFSLELEIPKYRLANGRTQAAQEKYLANNSKLVKDFFERDTESIEAQKIQHSLLKELVQGSKLYTYFKDTTNKQDQPLILTSDGYVVNGNRRLCAMRELYCGTPDKFGHFKHIDVVILPVCTPKDIDELEAYLQIQPDIKEEYTWISKACMLRARQQHHNYSHIQLADIYNIPEKEIRTILDKLALADDYLKSRNKEKQYDLVENEEFAFGPLLKSRQQLKQPDQKDLQTQISYILIDNSDSLKGRLYEWIPAVKDNLPAIAEGLMKTLPVTDYSSDTQPDNLGLLGPATTVTNFEPLVKAVIDAKNMESVLDVVTDVIESQKEKKHQKIKSNAVLKEVSDANAHLKTAINCIASDSIRKGIDDHLNSIEQSIIELRKWLSDNA